jgi:tetratricopeptide (TPR) repeat protein
LSKKIVNDKIETHIFRPEHMTATISPSIKLAKQSLFEKRYNKALTLSDRILKDDPACVDALLVKAIVLQKTKQLQESKNILLSMVSVNDNFLPGLVVLTQVLIELKDFSEAATFAEQALQLSPENPALWLDYSNCLYQVSSKQKADEAYKKHLIFDAKHPLLRQSLSAFFNGEVAKSERLVRRYLQGHPNDVNALRLLAEMAIQLGILGDAQSLLERTLSLAPDYHLARLNYAHTLNKRERSSQALEQIKLIEKAQPEHMPVQVTKAAILVKLGQYTQASELYSTILAKQPNQPQIWCSKGHVEKTLGNQRAAIECYHESIALMPEHGESYWSLANLKTYQFTDAEIANMEKVHNDAVNLKDEDNAHLCFALGKAFEANKNIAQSFHYYRIGNEIKKKLEPHDQSQIEQMVKRNIDFFNRYTTKASQQHEPSPIFIVGLPRSGSTLLEQILSSHSMVDGTKELPDIMAIARSLSQVRKREDENKYPQILEHYSPDQLAELGQKYLNGTEPHRGSAPYFLDKMPNNFFTHWFDKKYSAQCKNY